ncbi:MAG: PAS domain S-box protein, partial [Deltaproteobacteria bacterium]|nr:PAS domain S-box protein [Deltaproteobacteria bacterium]
MKDIMTPDSLVKAMDSFQKWATLAEGKKDIEIPPMEYEYVRKDGSIFWGEIRVTFLRDSEGHPFATQGILRDITERKRAEKMVQEEHQKLEQSEQKYRGLVEGINDGYLVVQNERVVFANQRAAEMIGYAVGERIGRHIREFLSPEAIKEVLEKYELRLLGETVPQQYETVLLRKDRTKLPVELGVTLTLYEGSPATSVLIRDITERKRAEEKLQESEQRFRAIFDNAMDGILLADPENKKFYIGNKAICQMLGYSLEEVRNLGVMDIHPEKELPYVTEQFERQARKEITLAKDIPVKRKDGSVFYADVNSSLVTLAGKAYLLGIFRDITERKRAEEALQKSEEKYRKTFESTGTAMVIIEEDTTISLANLEFAKL